MEVDDIDGVLDGVVVEVKIVVVSSKVKVGDGEVVGVIEEAEVRSVVV